MQRVERDAILVGLGRWLGWWRQARDGRGYGGGEAAIGQTSSWEHGNETDLFVGMGLLRRARWVVLGGEKGDAVGGKGKAMALWGTIA